MSFPATTYLIPSGSVRVRLMFPAPMVPSWLQFPEGTLLYVKVTPLGSESNLCVEADRFPLYVACLVVTPSVMVNVAVKLLATDGGGVVTVPRAVEDIL